MKITSTHKEYDFFLPLWKQARDLAIGEKALKIADKAQHGTYILKPCSTDLSAENTARYEEYVERASLFNFTNRTEKGMIGMALNKPPIVDFGDGIKFIVSNIDGAGNGIVQQSYEVLSDILQTGNEGLFVDYPKSGGVTTKGQAESEGITARVLVYKAESILDWRISGNKLTMVKLLETGTEAVDVLETKEIKQYRVLTLEDGIYTQRLYNENDEVIGNVLTPSDGAGAKFSFIPFFFVGAINNMAGVDPSPMQEIQDLNIKHYRNSADWEESCFMVGQPTPVMTGLTQQWLDDILTGGIKLGSRAVVPLPAGAAASLLQVNPNTMPELGMDRKEAQAIALGARLITSGGGVETAEAAYIKHAGDASVLKIIINNINRAYKSCIEAVKLFENDKSESRYEMNDDFIADKLTGEQITSLVAAWQQGVIDKDVLDGRLIKGGVIPESVDVERMNNNINQNMQGVSL